MHNTNDIKDGLTFADVHSTNCPNVIFRGIAGSIAYGTNHDKSDTDIRGIFITPKNAYLSLVEDRKQITDAHNDICYYSLRRFCELAATSNPNFIELLFLPRDCILFNSCYFSQLQNFRTSFISKMAAQSHLDYALAQIKKAKGKNKRVHNPCPIEVPQRENFCWFIPAAGIDTISRPIPIQESGHRLSQCHVAAVEHGDRLYRLYDYKECGKGVFRNGVLVCDSIPLEDETKYFCGYLLIRDDIYTRAITEHRQYWEWYNNRNAERWQSQQTGEMDYDAKNMMHTFRLIYSGINILTNGIPIVRFSGEKLQFLLDIKAGKFSYEELQQQIDKLVEELTLQQTKSKLSSEPNCQQINRLLISLTDDWEKDHGY